MPIEITFTPCATGGRIISSTRVGRAALPRSSTRPSRPGIEKPCTSASTSPTERPRAASATARFAVIVDLPTPPLPLVTAMTRVRRAGAERHCRARLARRAGARSARRAARASSPKLDVDRRRRPATDSAACRTSRSMRSDARAADDRQPDADVRRARRRRPTPVDHVELGDGLADLGVDDRTPSAARTAASSGQVSVGMLASRPRPCGRAPRARRAARRG